MCSPCEMAERPHPHKATAQRSLGVPLPPSLCMAESALNQEPEPCTLVSVRAPDRMRFGWVTWGLHSTVSASDWVRHLASNTPQVRMRETLPPAPHSSRAAPVCRGCRQPGH